MENLLQLVKAGTVKYNSYKPNVTNKECKVGMQKGARQEVGRGGVSVEKVTL